MPRIIVSIDDVVVKEVQLTKSRTSLGRRPYNDVVIDNLVVSGEHAVLQLVNKEVHVEDLNSTNGTYVNGKVVKKQLLNDNDVLEIGKYKIRYVYEGAEQRLDKRLTSADGGVRPSGMPSTLTVTGAVAALSAAALKVMSGAAAGREVALVKVVTTVGKPGIAVAAITHRQQGFVLAHVEGTIMPVLNGMSIGKEPVNLKNGDVFELAGTQMQFVQG